MKLFYEVGYRFFRMPWEMGPRRELVQAVETGRVQPCRALDLGCGSGSNAIFLAQHGFLVAAVDFASSAIAKARRRAEAANVSIDFVVDDLTHPRRLVGPFDFLVDYGMFDDLDARGRERYVANILPLAGPASPVARTAERATYREQSRYAARGEGHSVRDLTRGRRHLCRGV